MRLGFCLGKAADNAMRIFWQDTMRLGLATLDDEHKRMVGLLDGVCLALQYRDLPTAAQALGQFSDVLNAHFTNEEMLLDQSFNDGAESHRQGHRETIDLVDRLRSAINDDGDLVLAEHLVAELVTQWIRRLFREDSDLVARLKGRPALASVAG